MNAAEKLAREINRVTLLRCQHEEAQRLIDSLSCAPVMTPAMMLIDLALEEAYVAAGSNDAMMVLSALQNLGGFTE